MRDKNRRRSRPLCAEAIDFAHLIAISRGVFGTRIHSAGLGTAEVGAGELIHLNCLMS